MSIRLNRVWAWGAVLLPLLGVSLLVAKAEIAVHRGVSFRIPIRGYDPRDLFRGQYLQYRYEFNWQGDTCLLPLATLPDATSVTAEPGDNQLRRDCCLCLTHNHENGSGPWVSQVNCEARASLQCAGWLRSKDVMPPQRYFIPEAHATELQVAIGTQNPSIELVISPNSAPAIKELYLNERPWRDALASPGVAK